MYKLNNLYCNKLLPKYYKGMNEHYYSFLINGKILTHTVIEELLEDRIKYDKNSIEYLLK